MRGIVANTLSADGQWHDVARFQLRPGTWDVQYSSYTTSTGFPYYDSTITGGVQCKLSVAGETIALDQDSNGRFGQYLQQKNTGVPLGTTVTWSCINTVAKAGVPAAISMEFWQEESTPPTQITGEAL
jgi:hypothetical protein